MFCKMNLQLQNKVTQMKKLLTKTTLVAALMAVACGSALAVTPANCVYGMGHELGFFEKMFHNDYNYPKLQERYTKQMAEFKTKLGITAAQDAAWLNFTLAMQPSRVMHDMRIVRNEMENLSTPGRIDKINAIHAERQDAMVKHGEAIKTFYEVLTFDQRKIFDDQSKKMMVVKCN